MMDYLQAANPYIGLTEELVSAVDSFTGIWRNRNSIHLNERDISEGKVKLTIANSASEKAGNLREHFQQGFHVLMVAEYARKIAEGICEMPPYDFLHLDKNDVEYMALLHDLGRIISCNEGQPIHSLVGYLYTISIGAKDIALSGQLHLVTIEELKMMQTEEDEEYVPGFKDVDTRECSGNLINDIVSIADASCSDRRIGLYERIRKLREKYPPGHLKTRAFEGGGEQRLFDTNDRLMKLWTGALPEDEVASFYKPVAWAG